MTVPQACGRVDLAPCDGSGSLCTGVAGLWVASRDVQALSYRSDLCSGTIQQVILLFGCFVSCRIARICCGHGNSMALLSLLLLCVVLRPLSCSTD